MLAWLLGSIALAGSDRIHVRDLPDHAPASLEFDARWDRLVVDGALVKGSRHAQLDWLGEVFADASGEPPPILRLEERHRALHRRSVGGALALGGAAAGGIVLLAVPPVYAVVLPVVAATAAVEGTGVATLYGARRRFASDELARQTVLLHALETADVGP